MYRVKIDARLRSPSAFCCGVEWGDVIMVWWRCTAALSPASPVLAVCQSWNKYICK